MSKLLRQVTSLIFILLAYTEAGHAQFTGARAPRKTARIVIDYQTDVLNEDSDKRITKRQKIAGADVDVNVFKSKKYSLRLGGKFNNLDTGSNNIVLDGQTNIGRSLTDQIYTVTGTNRIDEKGRALSLSLSYGSASDNSFGREKDSAVSLTAVYSLSKNEKSQWLILANYSNNRAFLNNIPLPSLLYLYNPSKYFVASIGFPFVSLNWMDYKTYFYKVYFSPVGLGFDLSKQIYGPAMAYTKFDFRVNTYMHENRLLEKDRLFYEDKKFEIGLKSYLSKIFQLSIGLGYSFDRKIYEAESVFESDINKQNLGKDIYLTSKLTMDF